MSTRARLAVLALATAGLLGGCASVSKEDADVRAELHPELRNLSQRPIDWDNRALLTIDTNGRAAVDDLTRIFLLDRPTRLTREPMPR